MRGQIAVAVVLALPTQLGATVADCGGCFCIPEEGESCPDFEPVDTFSDELIEEFKSKALLNPFSDLTCDPYTDGNCETTPARELVGLEGAVCAFKYSSDPTMCSAYEMESYPSEEAALADGAFVTHLGACGLCSTAQDLAAYMANPDMTSAGKKCATKGIINEHWGKKCYEDLGFTPPCATIWNYDGVYDGKECAWTCIRNLRSDNNGPPPLCELNDCLQCDEDKAGPAFKDFAGRTRRRSGLPSAIARSCSEFPQIIHEPCPEVEVVAVTEEVKAETKEEEQKDKGGDKLSTGLKSSCWDELSDCESWCGNACSLYPTPYGPIYCC